VSSTDRQNLLFGPYQLDRNRRCLFRDGVAIPLRPRALDVLVALAMANGETMSKDSLLRCVWPGRAVEENNLQVHISALRKVLGDAWIITVPGYGYRLRHPSTSEDLVRRDGPGGRPSIAVLPFANLSGDTEQEYLADGVAHDIITELSRNRSLMVVAYNSSFSYKGRKLDVKAIARELGVRYMVEGGVRRNLKKVWVNAELIDVANGSHIWVERYHRELSDIFEMLSEIASAVAIAIGPAIVDAEVRRVIRKAPAQLDAWEAHQRGLWHWARGGNAENTRARDFFLHAQELDPMFAAPRAMLAFVYLWEVTLGVADSLSDNLRLAEREARNALQLGPDDAMALALMSWVSFYHGDLRAALEHAETAITSNHNDGAAYVAKGNALLHSNRPAEAREPFGMALRLNPRDTFGAIASMNLAVCEYFERNYETAAEVAERTVRAYPTVPYTYRWLAAALGQLGRIEEAQTALRKALDVSSASFGFFTGNRPPWSSAENHNHLLEGLRKAGW
jgi:adenylate cyclase